MENYFSDKDIERITTWLNGEQIPIPKLSLYSKEVVFDRHELKTVFTKEMLDDINYIIEPINFNSKLLKSICL